MASLEQQRYLWPPNDLQGEVSPPPHPPPNPPAQTQQQQQPGQTTGYLLQCGPTLCLGLVRLTVSERTGRVLCPFNRETHTAPHSSNQHRPTSSGAAVNLRAKNFVAARPAEEDTSVWRRRRRRSVRCVCVFVCLLCVCLCTAGQTVWPGVAPRLLYAPLYSVLSIPPSTPSVCGTTERGSKKKKQTTFWL